MKNKGLSPKELNKELAKRCGYYHYEIEDVLTCLFSYIQESLSKNVPVRLKDIGVLYTKKQKPRTLVNFQTKEPYITNPRVNVKFDITTTLLNHLNPNHTKVE